MDRGLRFLTILLGILILLIGIGIIGLAFLCDTISGCAIDVTFLGIPAVGVAVFFAIIGALMIAGGAVAHTPEPVERGASVAPTRANPNLIYCPACGKRTDRRFNFCQICGKPLT